MTVLDTRRNLREPLQAAGAKSLAHEGQLAYGEAGLHRYLLAFLILILPIQFETSLGLRLAPADLVLLLILLLGGIWMRTAIHQWTPWHALLGLVFSFALFNGLVRYGSLTRWAVVNKYVGFLLLTALYLVVVQYAQSTEAIKRAARLVLLSAILQAAVAFPLYLLGFVYAALHTSRIAGLLIDPNAYGGFMVVALCLHWCTVNTPGRLVSRRWAWLVTVLLLLNLFFSFSRSAWIGFAVLCLATPFVNLRAWRHLVLPIVLGTAAALLFFRPYFATELAPLITRTSQVTARLDILAKATDVFFSHPILGAGLGSFLRDYEVQVHNTFFWFLAEMGIAGAVVFVGFVMAFLLRGIKAYRLAAPEYRGLLGGLLLAHLSMMGFSLGIEAFYQRYWWVIMALLSAAHAAARQSARVLH